MAKLKPGATCLVGLFTLLGATRAWALPGARVPSISTFDTRGSTVVLAYREGFSEIAFRALSYNANFSSTGGNFSAQFGAHYVQVQDVPEAELAHGAGAGGVGLFSVPLSGRFDNGVPGAALDLYMGAAPTAAVSGLRNFLTAPLVLGVGVSFGPAHWFTVTPWVEVSPSVNLDTFVDSEGVEIRAVQRSDGSISVTPIGQALAEAVDTRVSFHLESRAGLFTTTHLGETWDLNVHAEFLTFGSVFGGRSVVQAGAGLAFHWDDVVPAVLPAARRLSDETCEAIEARFQVCPRWRELQTKAAAAPLVPPAPAPSAPPPPAVLPPAPPMQPPPEPAPSQSAPAPAPTSDGPPRTSFPPPP